MHFFTEAVFENAVQALFREKLGYTYIYGPNIVRDRTEPHYRRAGVRNGDDYNPMRTLERKQLKFAANFAEHFAGGHEKRGCTFVQPLGFQCSGRET